MNKYAIILLLLLLYAIYPLQPVLAVDSSPSANLNQDLKNKLDELKKEIASKAAKLKQEVNRKLQNKAYAGVLKSKTGSSITLASESGVKIITVNQDTVYESSVKTKKSSLKNLAEEDYIAALGDIDDNSVLTARKIILLPSPAETKTYLWGQIVSISDKLMTIQGRDLKKTSVVFPITSFESPAVRDFVIITGIPDKNDLFQADFVYIIPQGGKIIQKRVATPSAKIASPSGKKR